MEIPNARQGAISWTTHVLLDMMKQEWERTTYDETSRDEIPQSKRPSRRVFVVILFWTLFEHLIDRFYETALNDLPDGVRRYLLQRNRTIGSRLDQLYKLAWGNSLKSDLDVLGYPGIYELIIDVQASRNSFIHGNPEAIDDSLVARTVERLQDIQKAWIGLYNLRCSRKPDPVPIWNEQTRKNVTGQ